MQLTHGVLAVSTSLLLVLHVVHGQDGPPYLIPSTNQTVANNLGGNVTYKCKIPRSGDLMLLWEVNNLQITLERRESFENKSIFVENDPSGVRSTLIFTQQALVNDTEYTVLCLSFNALLNTFESPPVFVKVYGPPAPPLNLNVAPFTDTTLLITWDRPLSTLPEVSLTYNVTITNSSAGSVEFYSTNETSLEYVEEDMSCHVFLFEVVAVNDAGTSDPVSVNESIPISPDLSSTDTSLRILYVDVSSSSAAKISVSFFRAMSCSPTYSVTSHTVQVIGGGGEVVREAVAGPQGAGDLLQAMVGGIPRDAQFTVRVEACNVLLCRTSRAVDLLTTDVQTAAAFFFETFISLSCTFGWGSVARGCVVTLQLGEGEGEGEVEGGGEGGGREVFRLGRQEGSSESSTQCNRTENSRMAYQVISAADWESDGTVGSYSIPVATNVTEQEEDFPCPTGDGGSTDGGLSGGAIAGVVIGTTLFVVLVTLVVVFVVFYWYYRTRDVKKKSDGAISIEERSLLPSTEADKRNVSSLASSPFTSLPARSAYRPNDPTPYASATMTSSASMPTHSLQTSLQCGPVGELSLPKKGKVYMKIWSDTLQRWKDTGKTKFHLLPLLEDPETEPEAEPEISPEPKNEI